MAFVNVAMCLCNPGDTAILFTPYYFSHRVTLELHGITPMYVECDDNLVLCVYVCICIHTRTCVYVCVCLCTWNVNELLHSVALELQPHQDKLSSRTIVRCGCVYVRVFSYIYTKIYTHICVRMYVCIYTDGM